MISRQVHEALVAAGGADALMYAAKATGRAVAVNLNWIDDA